jgi:TonB family protein
MGISEKGHHILLVFNIQKKEIILFNIDTKEQKIVLFNDWKSGHNQHFLFLDRRKKFYHVNPRGTFEIDCEGNINKIDPIPEMLYKERLMEIDLIVQRNFQPQPVFKNTNSIYINANRKLVFNKHELGLNRLSNIEIMIPMTFSVYSTARKQNKSNIFTFTDGSTIEVNRNGLFILKSSNGNIPTIYIPSILDTPLGVATADEFAGGAFFRYAPLNQVVMTCADFYEKYIARFINNILETESIFRVDEEQAEYPEGKEAMFKFLSRNIFYPPEARERNIQGKVIVKFKIDKDGSIFDITIEQGIHHLLDNEAIKVIEKMPKWKPGKQKGQPVISHFTIPLVFKLEG